MKLHFRKRHLNTQLFFGILWISCFVLEFIFLDEMRWSQYGFLIIGIAYLIWYFFMRTLGFIHIEEGEIQVNDLFRKRIRIAEIQQAKIFAGDYILKTTDQTLTLNSKIMAPESLRLLEEALVQSGITLER